MEYILFLSIMFLIVALVGILGARLGYPFLDPFVALIICALILKVSYDILKQSIVQLIDQSASEEDVNIIANRILSVDGVIRIDSSVCGKNTSTSVSGGGITTWL